MRFRAFSKLGLTLAAIAAVGLLVGWPGMAYTASFTALGDLAGGSFSSLAFGVSADGSTVVGVGAPSSGNEAFRWTGGVMTGLGDLLVGSPKSQALGVSADGSVVVGRGKPPAGWFLGRALRWEGGAITSLGDLPGGQFQSEARGVSADGSVIVGSSSKASGLPFPANFSAFEAFRWTSGGGMVGLGDLPGGSFSSLASGVSADGSVIVGRGLSASGSEAFRWTSGGGMVGLGDLAGGSFGSEAFGVSADGSVVVGQGTSASVSPNEAFRWTSGGGMVGLGDLPGGGFESRALAASADGSVVVGHGFSSINNEEAFIWDATNGMQSLMGVLSAQGAVIPAGWNLRQATGVSGDGLTIAGTGINPFGQTEAWVAQLGAPIPEPATLLLLGSGLLGLGLVRRRRKM